MTIRTLALIVPIVALVLGGTVALAAPATDRVMPSVLPDPGPKKWPPIGPVVNLCFSQDGQWVLTGDYRCRVSLRRVDSSVPLWTTTLTQKKNRLENNWEFSVLGLAFAADEKRVFAAWGEEVVELDRESGAVVRTAALPHPVPSPWTSGCIPLVAFLPGSEECIYHGDNGFLVRFDFKARKLHDKFALRLEEVVPLQPVISPDGKRVFTYRPTRVGAYMAEWDLESGELLRQFRWPFSVSGGAGSAGYMPTGDGIWVWGLVEREVGVSVGVTVLDTQTGKKVALPGAMEDYRGWLWFSPDGKHALGLPADGSDMDVIGIEDGKRLHKFSTRGIFQHRDPPNDPKGWLVAHPCLLGFSRDGGTAMLSGVILDREWGNGPALGFWDVRTGRHLRTLRVE